MQPTIHSKEVIKNRMQKHALTYWGIKNTADLDPAVKMILEALAVQVSNRGNRIKEPQQGIVEKIPNLLPPRCFTAPSRPHALRHGAPWKPWTHVPLPHRFLHSVK